MKDDFELVDEARKALQSGKREIEGYKIITSKIDLDVKLDELTEIPMWDVTRSALIDHLGGIVIDIISIDSERGHHTVINWLTDEVWTDLELNFIQLLLGDDIVRYKINKARLERGVSWEESNILFSKVLQRFKSTDDTKLKVAIERIVGEIK